MDSVNDDTVYDRVMQYLFRSGAMQPGERVVETQLAARLGVSRIPVGKALGRLRGQGLLVSDGRGRGLRLRQYSLDEIADFYDYRELLEGGAARAAARAASTWAMRCGESVAS
jgi:DNA-binding GntR family transcriptional regulator